MRSSAAAEDCAEAGAAIKPPQSRMIGKYFIISLHYDSCVRPRYYGGDWPRAAGQGALTPVRQMLPRNVLAPSSAKFLISTPLADVWSRSSCTGGLPTMRFRRMTLPRTPAVIKRPFVFPTIVFSSTTLSLVPASSRPMPKLVSCWE